MSVFPRTYKNKHSEKIVWAYDFRVNKQRFAGVIGEMPRGEAEALLPDMKRAAKEAYQRERLIVQEARQRTRLKALEQRLGLATQFREFTEKHLAFSRANNRASITARIMRTLTTGLYPHFGHKRLDEITPFAVETFKQARQAEGMSAWTINIDLATLKAMMNRAVEWGASRRIRSRRSNGSPWTLC
jgi:hypothetical protein